MEVVGQIWIFGLLTGQVTHLWIWPVRLLTIVARAVVSVPASKELMPLLFNHYQCGQRVGVISDTVRCPATDFYAEQQSTTGNSVVGQGWRSVNSWDANHNASGSTGLEALWARPRGELSGHRQARWATSASCMFDAHDLNYSEYRPKKASALCHVKAIFAVFQGV